MMLGPFSGHELSYNLIPGIHSNVSVTLFLTSLGSKSG
jgi:hypothetical protein